MALTCTFEVAANANIGDHINGVFKSWDQFDQVGL